MSRRRGVALAALAAVTLGGCTREPGVEREQAVRDAFAAYKTAAMSGDGGAAAALLSSMTVNHFGRLRDLALYAPAEEILSHPAVNQLTVFQLRQFVPAEELREFSPEQTLAFALSRGWIGRDVVARVELGRIELHGSAALAEVLVDGTDNGWWHILLEEDGRWRFELLQGYGVAESHYSAAAQQHGVGATHVVIALVQRQAGTEIDAQRLLQPLVPPAPEAGPPAS